jgi:pSer/pThr/pTyr-binding forkhead associated (FHA) protein
MVTGHVTLTIGTAEQCDIRLVDVYASPVHAKLTIYADRTVTIEDCGSTNGTFIMPGLRRVYGAVPCSGTYQIRVGRTELSVIALIEAAARMRSTT